MFSLHYHKEDNKALFKSLEREAGLYKPQNYIPLYRRFFSLDADNYNNINLNQRSIIKNLETSDIKSLEAGDGQNRFMCMTKRGEHMERKALFFKFSPLLDPTRYMVGKYPDLSTDDVLALPALKSSKGHKKTTDPNNSAYVDGFFCYLTAQVLSQHRFLNGLDFYGSYIGIKNSFVVNVIDDLEFLYESDFFHKNRNNLFQVDNMDNYIVEEPGSHTNKERLTFVAGDIKIDAIKASSIEYGDLFPSKRPDEETEIPDKKLVFTGSTPNVVSPHTDSTCSSRSSHTDDEMMKVLKKRMRTSMMMTAV